MEASVQLGLGLALRIKNVARRLRLRESFSRTVPVEAAPPKAVLGQDARCDARRDTIVYIYIYIYVYIIYIYILYIYI